MEENEIYNESESESESETESDTEEIEKKGKIYIITSKTSKLQYIGQTKNVSNRWDRHVRDAFKNRSSREIQQAIRKYGKDDFEVKIIEECHLTEMDDREIFYINSYNTLFPNGYNMTHGGKNGKHCEESNRKKLLRNFNFTEQAKENMSIGQVGKRYDEKERKYTEDENLPKYIASIRQNKIIIGYQIKKFPMGIDKKEYIYKTIKNKAHPEIALEQAKAHLVILQEQYEKKLKIKQDEMEMITKTKALKLPKYPDNLFPIITNDKVTGYYVKMNDFGGKQIPRKDFENYDDALNFIKEIKDANDNKIILPTTSHDNEDALPLNIYKTSYKNIHNGYRVKLLTGYDDKKKPIYAEKNFTGPKHTMEEKLELAVQFINFKSQSS